MFSNQFKLIVCAALSVAIIEAVPLFTEGLNSVKVLHSNVNLTANLKRMQDSLTRPGDKQVGQRVKGDKLLTELESWRIEDDSQNSCFISQVSFGNLVNITFVNATNQGPGEIIVAAIDISVDTKNQTVDIDVKCCPIPTLPYDLIVRVYGFNPYQI
ncbi:hypothetical protein HHI36_021815 [Cryptolaemus montrouzieri]|uniref:Uncharacterized protein n=1 Tax=Cryptolaemus montrouzieri TaxID=559131 RepID=A0ABD2MYN3_9CUCU